MEATTISSDESPTRSHTNTNSTADLNTPSVSLEAKPLLGMNLNDYFLKRYLVDQQPEEPMPPIENPLETTQNHEDWIRGQEDFKIRHELLQSLHIGKPSNFLGEPSDSSHAFSVEMQRELAKFNASFEQKSWETLTLGNKNPALQNISFANMAKEGLSFTRNES